MVAISNMSSLSWASIFMSMSLTDFSRSWYSKEERTSTVLRASMTSFIRVLTRN